MAVGEGLVVLLAFLPWIVALGGLLWVLLAMKDMRDTLRQIAQQQEDMLSLQRIWTRFCEQQEELLRLQRDQGREPQTGARTKPPTDFGSD
jgi:hypothetical protein